MYIMYILYYINTAQKYVSKHHKGMYLLYVLRTQLHLYWKNDFLSESHCSFLTVKIPRQFQEIPPAIF